MHLITALLSIGLLGGMFYGYVTVVERAETKERHAASGHFIRSVQNTVYEWHASERQQVDVQGWCFPSNDDRNTLTGRLPRDSLSGARPTITVSEDKDRTLIWSGVSHGAGHEFAMTWPIDCNGNKTNPSIEFRLLGSWRDDHINYLVTLIPTLQNETSNPIGSQPQSLLINLPHPTSQSVLSNAMRRSTVQQGSQISGLVSPLVFDAQSFLEKQEETTIVGEDSEYYCGDGSYGGLTVDEKGVPYACVDHDGIATTKRAWKPMISTNIYCRDLRLTPADPYYTKNAPGHVAVIDADWSGAAQNDDGKQSFKMRVPAIALRDIQSEEDDNKIKDTDWQCPKPFVLETPPTDVRNRYCTYTVNKGT